MPAVRGAGRWQTSILAALDGQPRLACEVVTEILGRPPTHAEFNSCHRAVRSLIDAGKLTSWHEPVPRRPPQLMVRKVDRWICDGDGGTFAEQAQATDKLQQFCDRAWKAFATDPAYGTEIAEAAALLAAQEHRNPALANPRDADTGHAAEPEPRIAPGVRPRSRARLARRYLPCQGNW